MYMKYILCSFLARFYPTTMLAKYAAVLEFLMKSGWMRY